MPELEKQQIIGQTNIIEVYDFYDFPRFYLCRNHTGQHFLVLSVEEDDDTLTWLYLPISKERLIYVRSGSFSLTDAFQHAEDGYLYVVTSMINSNDEFLRSISCNEIPPEWLPDSEEKIEVQDDIAALSDEINPYFVAKSSHRETFNMQFEFPACPTYEAPAKRIGTILSSCQSTLDAIGQFVCDKLTTRGTISYDILSQTQMNLSLVYQSSFGVQLKSNIPADLFNDSVIGESIKEFSELLSTKDNESELSERLHRLQTRVAVNYRTFLKTLLSSQSDIRCFWGSPKRSEGLEIFLNKSEIDSAFKAVTAIAVEMEDQEYHKNCILIGINIRTKSFEIEELETGTKLTGKIADEALPNVSHATVSESYTAVMKLSIEANEITGEEKEKWFLFALNKE